LDTHQPDLAETATRFSRDRAIRQAAWRPVPPQP
jgi:hypothetical protein